MDRNLALTLFEIYKLEHTVGREIYEKEIITHGICSKHKAKEVIEELLENFSIEERNLRGSNVYNVTNIGRAHLDSYLDIRREKEKIQKNT